MGKTSSAVKDRYNAKAYDFIRVIVPKGKREAIAAEAKANGESMSAYICRAILVQMGANDWADVKANNVLPEKP